MRAHCNYRKVRGASARRIVRSRVEFLARIGTHFDGISARKYVRKDVSRAWHVVSTKRMLVAMATDAATDLVTVAHGTELAGTIDAGLVARAQANARRVQAPATAREYARDWARFSAWCGAHGVPALPASEATICTFLTAASEGYELGGGRPSVQPGGGSPAGGGSASFFRPLKPSSLARLYAAIRAYHADAGMGLPTLPLVRNTLQACRRARPLATRKASPLMASDVRRIAREDDDDDRDTVRAKGLLLLGFAAALRRSELVALEVDDLAFTEDGLRVTVRRSKTDQAGEGRVVGVPFGRKGTCPVRAVKRWMEKSGITEGRVFDVSGRTVARLVARVARDAGLAGRFSGHSLRAGLATSAAKAGVGLDKIMATTGHKSQTVAMGYVRHATVFDSAASEGLL
jgi:integrase